MKDTSIQQDVHLTDFFRKGLQTAQSEVDIQLAADTEFYLVSLLERLVPSHTRNQTSDLREPLAFKLRRSLNAEGPSARLAMQDLGESALLLASLFSGFLSRKLVDVEYCMGMGAGAYQRLAYSSRIRIRGGSPREAFEELAARFHEVVRILWAVRDLRSFTTQQDILRLYEVWVRTGNPEVAKRLAHLGITPQSDASLTHH